MNKENITRVLGSMARNIERNAYPELRYQFNYYERIFREHADEEDMKEFENIKSKAQDGIKYEAEHGLWSLLDHNHPVTIELKGHGFYKKLQPN